MDSTLPGYEQAAALVAAYAADLGHRRHAQERVPLSRASGRVLASPLRADSDQPAFARSTRDGFACRAKELSTGKALTVAGSTRAGESPADKLPKGAAWEIMTGGAVPPGADCVVMIEHVDAADGQVKLAHGRTIAAGANIVARGDHARKGDRLLEPGVAIGAAQVALSAVCGQSALDVYTRPRVAILTTGDEILAIEQTPGPGQIRNSNGPMLAALVAAAGAEPWVLPIARDEARSLDKALARAFAADMLVVTGGVSAGKFDLVEPALERLGAKFHFTGVHIQPGKPVVFGDVPCPPGQAAKAHPLTVATKQMPFFGLPGNPVSSAVTFLIFAAPVIAALAGSVAPIPRFVLARLARAAKRGPKSGLTRFLPAHCSYGAKGDMPAVELVEWKGSGDIAAMARGNCFLVLPEDSNHPEPDEIVRVLLY